MFYLRKASEKMISTRLNMAERAKDTSFTAKSLFEGLSGAQLTAGALAAVTSMLLSAQIGIAGSVIGVAVGSVVSTVASQVYKRFLEQSATKLRGMHDSDEESSTDGVGDAEGLEGLEAVPFGAEEVGTASTEEDVRADGPKAGQTEQAEFAGGSMRAGDQLASGHVVAGGVPGRATATPHLGDKSLAGDITAQHVREKREHDKRMQRGVIAVSIVSALVAVAVSAGFVMLTTQGQGLGAKPAAIEQAVQGNQDSDAQQDAQVDKKHVADSETSGDSRARQRRAQLRIRRKATLRIPTARPRKISQGPLNREHRKTARGKAVPRHLRAQMQAQVHRESRGARAAEALLPARTPHRGRRLLPMAPYLEAANRGFASAANLMDATNNQGFVGV